MVRRLPYLAILSCCVLLANNAWSAQISAHADRTQVTEDESFTLVFESQQSVDDDPDFAALEKDFQILSRNQSSGIQIINGHMSRQGQWTLTLLPKQPGTFNIPSIAFGKDRSNPLTIKVNPATQQNNTLGDSPVYFEVTTDLSEAYVQSQIILTARIYHAVNLMNASLSNLVLSDKTAVVEELDGEARFEKQAGGRRYKVIEKRYAIFPRATGQLTIDPLNLEVQYVSSRRALTTKRLHSESLHIKINPPVELNGNQASTWLPARSLILSEEFPKQSKTYRVGDPITRIIRVAIEGLPPELLPELDYKTDKSFKIYPERPVLDKQTDADGVTGVRQETVAIVPTIAGAFNLSAVSIPWFNIKSKKWELASLPSRSINVEAPEGSAQSTDQAIMAEQAIDNKLSTGAPSSEKTKNSPENKSIRVLEEKPGDARAEIWPWLAVLFFGLWVVTMVVWWRSKRRSNQNVVPSMVQPSLGNTSSSLKELQIACRSNKASYVKDALLLWGNSLGFSTTVTSLTKLAELVGEPLASEIKLLNAYLYSSAQNSWSGEPLLQALKQYKPDSETHKSKRITLLQPLYYAFDKGGR